MADTARGSGNELVFDVFGTRVCIAGAPGAWRAFLLGADGKRRPAGFIVPAILVEEELAQYLADLFHEATTPKRGDVVRIR